MAAGYDAGRGLTQATIDSWAAAIRPIVAVERGQHQPILDLGAGTGRFSGLLHVWSRAGVVAVEPADAMRRQLKEKGLAGVSGVIGASGEALQFSHATFGSAWLSQVVQHFEDLPRVARELGRVVRGRGVVMIRGVFGRGGAEYGRTTNALLYQYFPEALKHAKKYPDRDVVLETFSAAGFETASTQTVEQVVAENLAAYCEKVALRADSTLAAIDDEAFEHGLRALEKAARSSGSDPIVEGLDLLVLRRQPEREGVLPPHSD